MNHQQVFRLWLCVGCIAVVCLSVFSNGQAQDAVSPNNPGQAVAGEKVIDVRTTNRNPLAGTNSNGFAVDPSAASSPAGDPGLFNRRRGAINATAAGGRSFGTPPVHQPETNAAKLQKAIETLKQAKDEEARKKSLETLSSVVSQLFDEDLKRRESEVGDIRNRAAKLKALIDKRKESKDRIVDLQLKIQRNEVEGLGFAVKQRSGGRNPNQYYGGAAQEGMEMMMGGPGIMYSPVLGLPGEEDYGAGASTESADPRRKVEQTLRDSTVKLKQAKSEDDRRSAEKLLRSALEDYFAADLEIREREIKRIQKRITNLDKLIERRRQARDPVISLQLEVLTNEADGLGFFSTSARRSSNGNGTFHVNMPGMNQSFIGFTR